MSDGLTIQKLQEILLTGKPDEHEYLDSFSFQVTRQLIATMQREAKHVSALKIAKALTKKYLSRINFDGLNDREITELREIHYQTEEALRSEY